MGNVFINPNFHVVLVHLPLGVFLLGVLIELLSFMYRRSTLRLAGRWMILLGALATIPVAFTGIYALNDIANRSQADGRLPENATWAQVADGARLRDGRPGVIMPHLVGSTPHETQPATPQTLEAWWLFSRHAWVEGPASALVALTAILFLGLSDRMRRRLYFPALILLLAGAGLMTWGAWYAGESIYRFGSATRLQKALPAGTTMEAPSAGSTDSTSSPQAGSGLAPAAIAAPPTLTPPADSNATADSLPHLPPFHFAPAIVVSPTSEPGPEPSPRPATEPSSTAPAPTTEPTTAPTTSPAPETAPSTVPAPETATTPTTVPATETTLPTTTPAVVVPPPSVPPASVFPHLVAPPVTAPSVLAPSAPTVAVPAAAVLPPLRELEENKVDKAGTPAYYVGPPLQIHVLLAGLSVAIALGALGASMRRLALLTPASGPVTPDEAALEAEETEAILAANNAAGRRPVTGQDIDLLRTINPDLTVTAANAQCVPAARLWLFALLGVLLTAAAGIYVLAAPVSLGGDGTSLNTTVLWQAVIDKAQNPDGMLTRRLAHVIGGAALLLLPLLLAIFARWSKSKLALGLTSLLLVAVVAGQVWIGILLLYDSRLGKINHFNPAPVATPARLTSPV